MIMEHLGLQEVSSFVEDTSLEGGSFFVVVGRQQTYFQQKAQDAPSFAQMFFLLGFLGSPKNGLQKHQKGRRH